MVMADTYLIGDIVLPAERRYYPGPCAACWMIWSPSSRNIVGADDSMAMSRATACGWRVRVERGSTTASEMGEPMAENGSWLGRIGRRLIQPWMRARELAYYERHHCRWPSVRQGKWGANHVVCGEPPIDAIKVDAVTTIGELLSGGRAVGDLVPGGSLGVLITMPTLLNALKDRDGMLAVCQEHLNLFWGYVSQALDEAEPKDQERFKQWVQEQKPMGDK